MSDNTTRRLMDAARTAAMKVRFTGLGWNEARDAIAALDAWGNRGASEQDERDIAYTIRACERDMELAAADMEKARRA